MATKMSSSKNTWVEPVGYTSSFRPVRTPVRLNYGRDDAKLKETNIQNYHNQNRERGSRPFPFRPMPFSMELRPRKLIIPENDSSKKSKYSRSRSAPREVPQKLIISENASSKKSKYSRSRSAPREGLRKLITSENASSKKSKYSRSRSAPREGPWEMINSRSGPFQKLKNSHSHYAPREGKNAPYNRNNNPKRVPLGYECASPRTLKWDLSDNRYSSPRPRQENNKYMSRRKSGRGKSPLKKYYKSSELKHERRSGRKSPSPLPFTSKYHNRNDGDVPLRFLRSHSEPPRRSARIANLKKSDMQKGAMKENSVTPPDRRRAASRAKDYSSRDSRSGSKYKNSQNDYKSSVAISRYSSSSSKERLQNKFTKKDKEYPHGSSTSYGQRLMVSPYERTTTLTTPPVQQPLQEYDQSANPSSAGVFHESPSVSVETTQGDPIISMEGMDSSEIQDENAPNVMDSIENEDAQNLAVDVVNRDEDHAEVDNCGQLEVYEGGPNSYISNDALFSRREPSYVNENNAFRNNDYFSLYGPSRNSFSYQDNLRQGFDNFVPFHRRPMNVHETLNNPADFLSPSGFTHYEASSSRGPYSGPLSPTDYAYFQASSWQTAYNERLMMQNQFMNNNVSTQILCPDGGVLCVNENVYCLNRRVPLNNDFTS